MTAESEETCSSPQEAATENSNTQNLPTEILQIFEFLSCNEKIVFKSQQIDDPELQRNEKVQIAKDIFERNRQTFLMRFGVYLEESHLSQFAAMAIAGTAAPLKCEENCDEMELMLHDFQRKLQTRKRDVKNRRYTAMQQLIAKGEYFSEMEMMRRAPELYQELIGQHLSEAEKKQRDSYDVRNTTFSGILMHTMQRQQMKDVLEKATEHIAANEQQGVVIEELSQQENAKELPKTTATEEENDDNDGEGEEEEEKDKPAAAVAPTAENFEVPASFRQQWGNFENEQIACSTSRIKAKTKQTTTTQKTSTAIVCAANRTSVNQFITAGERDLLRQEFLGLMHEKFLAGLDEDFDYAEVDDNSQLDDICQLNQDKEDAYFEESDDDDDDGSRGNGSATIERMCGNEEEDEESDDELDIYMKHLRKHPSLKGQK